MRNIKAALTWIVNILRQSEVPFEIDGGLAAEMYGSPRELADIDINIQFKDFKKVVPQVKQYLKFGPAIYVDHQWRLYMMTLKYAGQTIDISAVDRLRYHDHASGQWLDFPSDLTEPRIMNYLGMDLPFINEIKLLIYKEKLHRGVDREDVYAMEEQLKKEWNLHGQQN